MNLQYVVTDKWIVDLLTKPLARLKFEYFREKFEYLSTSRFPPKVSDESVSHSDMVRGLVPSMVRCKG